MKKEWKKATLEVALAGVAATVFYLFAAAIFAAIVKACAPSQKVVSAVNWVLKGIGSFAFSLIFVRKGRALFKGAAAGALACVLSMLLFAAIGGFHITVFFPLELIFCAVLGGLGAALGVKLRKEEA